MCQEKQTLSDKVRRRIAAIYNNDGPGFYNVESLGSHYEEMLPKIQTYVPEYLIQSIHKLLSVFFL